MLNNGPDGSWDSGGPHTAYVLFDGNSYRMWFSGTDLQKFGVGYATSPDGIQWSKYAQNPVVGPGSAGSWEEFGSWAPRVLYDGTGYKMWYSGASGCQFCTWQIGYATSADGKAWQRLDSNPVLSTGWPGAWDRGKVNNGSVVFDGTTYRMWYDGNSWDGVINGMVEGIGHATSADGVHWAKDTLNPVLTAGPPGSWDAGGVGLPCVVHDVVYHMWYAGGTLGSFVGIGYASSPDGIHWTKFPGNPVLTPGPSGSWDKNILGAFVRDDGSRYQMWYGAIDPTQSRHIGYATSPKASATIFSDQSSIDFTNVHPGDLSDTLALTIRNMGFTTLSISSANTRQPEFNVCNLPVLPARVPPFEGIEIGVVFHPLQAGVAVLDTLVIASNDSLHPLTSILLRGRGSGAVQPALAGRLYGISASASVAELFDVNRSTGEPSLVAQFTPRPPPAVDGFAVRPSDRTMYAGYSSADRTDIFRMSSASGDLEPAGSIPLGGVTAMTFSSGDGLYLADARGRMYRLDTMGADTVLVGRPGVVMTGLAFSPATGILWGSARDTIYTIHTGTAHVTLVGRSGLVGRSSITFGPLGTLYGVFDQLLAVIDRSSGVATPIGFTGMADLRGIAMRVDPPAGTESAEPARPSAWKLYQNYPNPFNPTTVIRYAMPVAGVVTLKIFDMLGREIGTLVDKSEAAGIHTVRFDGRGLSSGLYYYRLQSGSFTQTLKLLVLR